MKSGRPHNLFLSNKRNYTFLRLCILSVISDASDRGREGLDFPLLFVDVINLWSLSYFFTFTA